MSISEIDIYYLQEKADSLEAERRQCIAHLNNLKRSYEKTRLGLRHKGQKKMQMQRILGEIKYTNKRIIFLENSAEKARSEAMISEEKLKQKNYAESFNKQTELDRIATLNWAVERKVEYDVFISHSSDDKESFARPLAHSLKSIGVQVWYDEFELKIGDSLRENIDKGLSKSRYGLLILSNSFFSRKWTEYELNGFVAKEMHNSKVILPIWHKVSKDEVIKFSPTLADKVALKSSDFSIDEIALKIKQVLI